MSCCGKQRQQFYSEQPGPNRNNFHTTPGNQERLAGQPFSSRQTVVCFEYTGRTAMTVAGAVTGKRYYFDRSGSKVLVDPRDSPSVKLVPNLKQVFI